MTERNPDPAAGETLSKRDDLGRGHTPWPGLVGAAIRGRPGHPQTYSAPARESSKRHDTSLSTIGASDQGIEAVRSSQSSTQSGMFSAPRAVLSLRRTLDSVSPPQAIGGASVLGTSMLI